MANKTLYIIGISVWLIFLAVTIIRLPLASGREGLAVKLIAGLFLLWLAGGIYCGVEKLTCHPSPSLNPTIEGVEYYPWHVPLRHVVLEFFNPLKMNFLTMTSIFIVGSLGIYTCLVSPRFKIIFWILLTLLILMKSYILIMSLKLESYKNI